MRNDFAIVTPYQNANALFSSAVMSVKTIRFMWVMMNETEKSSSSVIVSNESEFYERMKHSTNRWAKDLPIRIQSKKKITSKICREKESVRYDCFDCHTGPINSIEREIEKGSCSNSIVSILSLTTVSIAKFEVFIRNDGHFDCDIRFLRHCNIVSAWMNENTAILWMLSDTETIDDDNIAVRVCGSAVVPCHFYMVIWSTHRFWIAMTSDALRRMTHANMCFEIRQRTRNHLCSNRFLYLMLWESCADSTFELTNLWRERRKFLNFYPSE